MKRFTDMYKAFCTPRRSEQNFSGPPSKSQIVRTSELKGIGVDGLGA